MPLLYRGAAMRASACRACVQCSPEEFSTGPQRPIDSAFRSAGERRFKQDPRRAWRQPHSARVPTALNGLVDLGCAALFWYLIRVIGAEQAIGIIIGAYIATVGWRMLMAPAQASMPDLVGAFARLRAEANSGTAPSADLMWTLTIECFLGDQCRPYANIGQPPATRSAGDCLFPGNQPDLVI
jgi:hypothetical protein